MRLQDRNAQMRYEHPHEKAAEYLRMTLRCLGEHNLPSDPMNYTVWYEYVSRFNPPLVTAVDQFLEKTRAVTEDVSHFWFEEYVLGRDQALIQSIKSDLLTILREVFGDLSVAGENATSLGKNLARVADRIDQPNGLSLQESLKELLLEVKKFEETSTTLEKGLKRANEEVEALQVKLREVEQHATTDALTGLWNRRSLEEKLTHCLNQSSETGAPVSLIILDIDYFKEVNDTYGHLTGDDLLRVISKTLKDFVKGKDIVCRYGGEEFVVLLPDTPIHGAATVAETIRAHFAQMSWKQKSTGVSMGKVTLSAGVSAFRPEDTAETFVQRADVALYQSKRMGRNRVTLEKQ